MAENRLHNVIDYIGDESYSLTDGLSGLTYTTADLPPGSQEWFMWLASLASFEFNGKTGHFIARFEEKLQVDAPSMYSWYAYRQADGGYYKKQYLGKVHELIPEHLEHAAGLLNPAVSENMAITH